MTGLQIGIKTNYSSAHNCDRCGNPVWSLTQVRYYKTCETERTYVDVCTKCLHSMEQEAKRD